MSIQYLTKKIKGILLKPSETWQEIKEEETTISNLYKSYAMLLAAIPQVAQFIANSIIGYPVRGVNFRVRTNIGRTLGFSIAFYILFLVSLYVISLITNALAPRFNSTKNITNAFKLIVFSLTPGWIASILFIFPSLSPLVILGGIYWIYLLYLGLPLMMETPKKKSFGYVIIIALVTLLISFVINAIVSAIFNPWIT